MRPLNRTILSFIAAAAFMVGHAGCASRPAVPTAQDRQALAPTGKLRVGVYPGSPTSLVKEAPAGEARGVSVVGNAEPTGEFLADVRRDAMRGWTTCASSRTM